MELQDRVALVTGGAHRVGGELSRALALAGAHVAVHYHSSRAAAAAMVQEIEGLGRRALALQADLSDAQEAHALIGRALQEFGRLDVLVNSASRFDRTPVAEITPAEWDRTLALNTRAPFLLSQAAAPALRERHGCIVNLLDLSAFQAWPSFLPHAVSKAALLHLTRCLARALAPAVRVNAIAPGTVLPPEGYDHEDYAGGIDRRVLERAGTPQDVATALLYLIRNDFVTGDVLVVDGGRTLL